MIILGLNWAINLHSRGRLLEIFLFSFFSAGIKCRRHKEKFPSIVQKKLRDRRCHTLKHKDTEKASDTVLFTKLSSRKRTTGMMLCISTDLSLTLLVILMLAIASNLCDDIPAGWMDFIDYFFFLFQWWIITQLIDRFSKTIARLAGWILSRNSKRENNFRMINDHLHIPILT